MFAAIGANWFTARRQRVSVISINRFHPTILANYVAICVANVTDCPLKVVYWYKLGYPISLLTPKTAPPCPSKDTPGSYRVNSRPAPTPETSGSHLGVPGAGPRVWF